MQVLRQKTFEFTITETRTYTVLGSGHNSFEAEQDAIARFHRLTKSKEIVCDKVSRPRVTEYFLNK